MTVSRNASRRWPPARIFSITAQWKGISLNDLVRSQLAHFKELIGTRIELQGPSLMILASAAQPIGMALHERATNAGKYGALSGA